MEAIMWLLIVFMVFFGICTVKLLEDKKSLEARVAEQQDEINELEKKNNRLENEITLRKLNYRGDKNDNK